tara:strand:- start:2386 stop:2658 length:273 start_codon:yes stop_codon:yes gene_type:complete
MALRVKSNSSAQTTIPSNTKLGQIIRLLQRTKGATLEDLIKATGWQPHSVRGAISGSLRKRHGLTITAATDANRGRVYRLSNVAAEGGRQ